MDRTLDRDRAAEPVVSAEEPEQPEQPEHPERPGQADEAAETGQARRLRELTDLVSHGLTAGIGVGHSLGVLLSELGDGLSVWTLTPSPAAANAMYTVHGGVISTLMDTAMGSAVYTRLPDGMLYTTLELKVNFIRAVALDDEALTCVATAVHVGRRTATAEARVTNHAGALVAHGTSTCLLFEAAGGPA
ncbi:phenylacetic acid degradation protein [Parafrankia colletiae]|uniref:Phenylacetic acid degradation protein n=1 Tax=Parafrankia colletiae TaxID=573497 RepID=A0A1S1QGF9_9ACTN|nr:PaaI family thioesterase [Parafrankia colletiae]MCK9902896.1 PaaI family thioesterase [Frankia sp. Cpl3]OHV33060.1 phenylacetic acid degradation protein [Parafrankia colletiae]